MGGWTIHKMTCSGMQTLVTRIQLHMHYVPTFEMNIADLPLLPLGIAVKDKATLLRSYEDQYLFIHKDLLSSGNRKNVLNYFTINTPNYSFTKLRENKRDG